MPKPNKHDVKKALQRERAYGNDFEALIGAVDPTLPKEEKAVHVHRPRMSTYWKKVTMLPENLEDQTS